MARELKHNKLLIVMEDNGVVNDMVRMTLEQATDWLVDHDFEPSPHCDDYKGAFFYIDQAENLALVLDLPIKARIYPGYDE